MSALLFSGVTLTRNETAVLRGLDWEVSDDERWVVLGPNGSGKTTALRLAGAQLQPSSGDVQVLGCTLGRVDVRELRKRIGLVSGAIGRTLRPDLPAADVVLTGKDAALEPWWSQYSDADRRRARQLLEQLGVGSIADRTYAVVSEGERQHVLLARTLMGDPDLLLLDEPFAGLDLGARERLLSRLTMLLRRETTPPFVLVTHHAEEIPPGVTHAGLLREGRWVSVGPIEDTLTSENVSECFGLAVEVEHRDGRWSSRALGR